MIFDQFKDATKKDQKKKKETFTNRIEFLKTLKDDIQISQHIEPVNNVNNGQDYSFVWNIDVNETISTYRK